MEQYQVTLTGLTPLLMHADNRIFMERVKQWQKDPNNKELSVAGDDRSPAWIWIGYLYHDGRKIGMPSDNLMTMLREGGSKVPAKRGSYKRQTQAGIVIDQQQWRLYNGGREIDMEPIKKLVGVTDFMEHVEQVEAMGFELFVKPAIVNGKKHVRVRPIFREWVAVGSFTVLDEEITGLSTDVVATVLRQAGAMVGLGDWRPSSPRSPGSFGKFEAEIAKM